MKGFEMDAATIKSIIFTVSTVFWLAITIPGCGGDKQQSSTPEPQTETPSQAMDEPASEPAMTTDTEPQTADQPTTPQPEQAASTTQTEAAPPATTASSTQPSPAAASGDPQHGEMLALARKSGCLACHSVDKKIVGPAWKDVSRRYAGQAGIRDQLIEKISKGGRGNWTDVVGNVAMPPYHPRVSKENIGKLVDFVLSLAES
jgi:cytochrome c